MCIRILSFDPGLSLSGWNVNQCDDEYKKMTIKHCGMLMPNKDVHLAIHEYDCAKFGQRIITLQELRKQVCQLVKQYKPDFIVSEDAFYNPRRPTAYAALLQWITTVQILLKEQFNTTLFKLAPRIAKKTISGFGGAIKFDIKEAVLKHKDIVFQNIDKQNLTEHIYDSIGIGYTFIHQVLPYIIEFRSDYVIQEKE